MTATGQLAVDDVDPVTGSFGRVTKGARWVGDGEGALTVDGTVGARPVVPTSPWNTVATNALSATNLREPLLSRTGTTKLALTSMTLAAVSPAADAVRVMVIVYKSDSAGGDCDTLTGAPFGAIERFVVVVRPGDTQALNWPTPLVYTSAAEAGHKYCVDAEIVGGTPPAGTFVYVAASGFTF